MPFDLDDVEDAIDDLKQAVDALRVSLKKLADRFDVIESRASRAYLWAGMRDEEE